MRACCAQQDVRLVTPMIKIVPSEIFLTCSVLFLGLTYSIAIAIKHFLKSQFTSCSSKLLQSQFLVKVSNESFNDEEDYSNSIEKEIHVERSLKEMLFIFQNGFYSTCKLVIDNPLKSIVEVPRLAILATLSCSFSIQCPISPCSLNCPILLLNLEV